MKRLIVFVAILLLALLAAGCHRKVENGEGVMDDGERVMDSSSLVLDDGICPQPPASEGFLSMPRRSRDEEVVRGRRSSVVIYADTMLYGEWERGSEREQYMADHSGNRWDMSEDVWREEAQHFDWTLDSNRLTVTYHLIMGGVVPRQYMLTYVDAKTLIYRDDYGSVYKWDKLSDTPTDRPMLPL